MTLHSATPPDAEPTPVKPLEHVADMTRTRDRDLVDATLLSALVDLLPVEAVLLWRVLGEPGTARQWLRCGSQSRGDLVAQVAGPTTAYAPVAMQSLPDHMECFEQVRVKQVPTFEGCCVLLPMAGETEVEGVIELRLLAPLGTEQLRMAQTVLRIHRNFLSLLDYSERDTLTGLLNRKSFDETFMRATVREAERLYSPEEPPAQDADRRQVVQRRHWMAVIDIDHFKRVNDTYGHLIGDEVLVLVARIMRNLFRYDDRLYRFGGEEFLVLLAAPDETAAQSTFERLRRQLAQYPFPQVGQVTASIGFTDVRPGDTPQAAFERADRAVYYGKEHGRNQVQSYSELIAQGRMAEADNVGDVELF